MKNPSGKIIVCLVCKKEFYIPKWRIGTAKYCSRKCKNKFCTIKIHAICKICGKEFSHISSRCNKAKYCSRLCYHRSQKGKGSLNYKCKNCEKEFMGSPSRNFRFCTIKCRGEYQRHPDSYFSYGSARKGWKIRGWIEKCEICGFDKNKEILGLHHKDKNRGNNKKENLMVVCPTCHSIIHCKHILH